MDKIENLLQQVSIIQKKYDEIAKITGENFNIFSVMNMETDEVKTHSAIIGELLNTQGSHGQGSLFLDLFIDHLKIKFNKNEEIIKLDKFGKLVSAKICERTISISNNWVDVTGGRIDIILEDEKQICIIETKINAEDQGYQLIRYRNYAKNRGKKYYILYLTKEGKTLNDEAPYYQNHYLQLEGKPLNEVDVIVEGYNFHYEKKEEYKQHKTDNYTKSNIHQCLYYPISFSDDIKEWLEKCLEKTHSLPIIRETLVQYLYLIKKLTNQSTNNKMSQEIIHSILKNRPNFESAVEIIKISDDLKPFMIAEIINKMEKKLKKEGFEIHSKINFNSNKTGELISFSNDLMKKKDLCIRLNFEGSGYGNLIMGFYNTKDKILDEKLYINYEKIFHEALQTVYYPSYFKYEKYLNWWFETLAKIYFNYDEFEIDFMEKVNQHIGVL